MRQIASGAEICATITQLDGIVVARSAFESSMRYRSAMLFGTCAIAEGDEKAEALDALTDSLIPGRVAEVRQSNSRELAATLALRMTITQWSYKPSEGWPEDPDDDVAGPAWAGVLIPSTGYGAALPAPDLSDGIEIPASVAAKLAPTGGAA
jgi:hypothetical protein